MVRISWHKNHADISSKWSKLSRTLIVVCHLSLSLSLCSTGNSSSNSSGAALPSNVSTSFAPYLITLAAVFVLASATTGTIIAYRHRICSELGFGKPKVLYDASKHVEMLADCGSIRSPWESGFSSKRKSFDGSVEADDVTFKASNGIYAIPEKHSSVPSSNVVYAIPQKRSSIMSIYNPGYLWEFDEDDLQVDKISEDETGHMRKSSVFASESSEDTSVFYPHIAEKSKYGSTLPCEEPSVRLRSFSIPTGSMGERTGTMESVASSPRPQERTQRQIAGSQDKSPPSQDGSSDSFPTPDLPLSENIELVAVTDFVAKHLHTGKSDELPASLSGSETSSMVIYDIDESENCETYLGRCLSGAYETIDSPVVGVGVSCPALTSYLPDHAFALYADITSPPGMPQNPNTHKVESSALVDQATILEPRQSPPVGIAEVTIPKQKSVRFATQDLPAKGHRRWSFL